MITLKTLKWSNLFSYGEANEVDFTKNPLTQVVGGNGHGKSSIALILEEVLYNKNSKGIKKSDILNRNVKSKTYTISLTLSKDGDEYEINTVRGTTQTVKLTKNGEDISSHTATGTYKIIEELIGYDHKTFCQIVYQSSSNSLEFLTATDSARKKFLIDLLDLSRYVEIGEVFKEASKITETQIATVTGKISTAETWLTKYKTTDLTIHNLNPVPEARTDLEELNLELKEKLKNIDQHNKKILQNNKYKELLDSTVVVAVGAQPVLDLTKYTVEKAELAKTVKDCDSFIQKMNKLHSQCPTCLQEINKSKIDLLLEDSNTTKAYSTQRLLEVDALVKNYEKELKEWSRLNDIKTSYEQYYSLYDPAVETNLLDKADLETNISLNEKLIKETKDLILKITDSNNKLIAHNARVEVLKSQLEEMQASLDNNQEELELFQDKQNTLQVLCKTFSSTGLVAYKIECLIKDLESTTNEYLGDLSSGRFQIGFKIAGNDKLNVVITDNGKDIDMVALSGGEKARVNTAALLGIRKLMQSLSNTRINLLILDETIENLDVEGKEKLIEVLLQEEYLNTFIISHGFTHPLLEKLQIVKRNNMSRIDNG